MKQESLIESALQFASSKSVAIARHAVFDWCGDSCPDQRIPVNKPYPVRCNFVGAILLLLGLQDSIKSEFPKGWRLPIEEYLDANDFWIHRFHLGFDCGYHVKIIRTVDKKEIEYLDDVSKLGIKVSNRWTRGKKSLYRKETNITLDGEASGIMDDEVRGI